jgi:hypothetical protein
MCLLRAYLTLTNVTLQRSGDNRRSISRRTMRLFSRSQARVAPMFGSRLQQFPRHPGINREGHRDGSQTNPYDQSTDC